MTPSSQIRKSSLPEGWTSKDPVSTGQSPYMTPASLLTLSLGSLAVSFPMASVHCPALKTLTWHPAPASPYSAQLSACLSLSPAPDPKGLKMFKPLFHQVCNHSKTIEKIPEVASLLAPALPLLISFLCRKQLAVDPVRDSSQWAFRSYRENDWADPIPPPWSSYYKESRWANSTPAWGPGVQGEQVG